MKAAILFTLLVGAQSFAVVPVGRANTRLMGAVPEDLMTADQKEIKDIQTKWKSIRHMDRDTAAKELEGEWLEAYNRFMEKHDDDMERMTEIAQKLKKMIEPPKVAKKTKGQKRRDAYARKLARSGGSS